MSVNEKWMKKERMPLESRAGQERAEVGVMDTFKCEFVLKLVAPVSSSSTCPYTDTSTDNVTSCAREIDLPSG